MPATTASPIAHDRVKHSVDPNTAEVVADHSGSFRRDHVVYDLAVFASADAQADCAQDGAPFKDSELPSCGLLRTPPPATRGKRSADLKILRRLPEGGLAAVAQAEIAE